MQVHIPEKARTTNVNVAGNRKGWSTEIDKRSSPIQEQITGKIQHHCHLMKFSFECHNGISTS